ncbi:MAG TPA: TolC family protein [Saprospiraceae bacterium]|nr:TolC family protein [Saprospiraceae bacterium]
MIKKYILLGILFFIFILSGEAQNVLTLDSCYALARQNYPLIKQLGLDRRLEQVSLDNIKKGYWPQVNLNAQAGWQSDVTTIPVNIPNIKIPIPPQDQYKAYLDINQLLWDGGQIKLQAQQKSLETKIEAEKINTQLYSLREKINQLFFGILLVQEQLKINALSYAGLLIAENKINSAIKNGTMLRSNGDNIRAELLRVEQQKIEQTGNRSGMLSTLSWLLGTELDTATVLVTPLLTMPYKTTSRPELAQFEAQIKAIQLRNKLIQIRNLPRINLFVQTGYGRPALNMFSNSFDPYFIGGLRISVPLTNWYNNKNDHELIQLNTQSVDLQKEIFLYNLQLSQKQLFTDIDKYKQLIEKDIEIVALRQNTLTAAQSQLDHGVITIGEFLQEMDKIELARQQKTLHEIQLIQTIYNQKYLTGN